jgi:aspartate-semialdehyde dehydrogenase
MRTAIVGATGLVGQTFLKVLEQRNFHVDELLPVATEKSAGKKVTFRGQAHGVMDVEAALARKPELALFSAGAAASLELAPRFVEAGCVVVDNSSAWRMHQEVKLVVPEVNGHVLTAADKLIANPNCSTIQLVMALCPLHDEYGIERLVVSTYQSVSGTGSNAIQQYENEKNGTNGVRAYPHQIFGNVLPQCDVFAEDGYTKEEIKVVNETKKILGDPSLRITCTAARVPVPVAHSESVNVTFSTDFDLQQVRILLSEFPGVIVADDPKSNLYPMPITAQGRDEVFVGRIRRDFSQPNSLNMWIVSDNLRKGAATNAIQIAEYLFGLTPGPAPTERGERVPA